VTFSGGPGGSGTAQDGQTTSAGINFNQTNITTVTFQFSFSDRYRFSTLSPAGVTFKVTSPGNISGESTLRPGQSTATSVTIREVCKAPDPEEYSAANQAEAAKAVSTRHPANENGTGDWTIEITVTREYMSPIHPVGSIAWTASTRVDSYTLELSEKLAE